MRGGYKSYSASRSNPAYGRAQQVAGVERGAQIREYLRNDPDLAGMEAFVDPSTGAVNPAYNDTLDFKYGTEYTAELAKQRFAQQKQQDMYMRGERSFDNQIQLANLGLSQDSARRSQEAADIKFHDDTKLENKRGVLGKYIPPEILVDIPDEELDEAYNQVMAGKMPTPKEIDPTPGWWSDKRKTINPVLQNEYLKGAGDTKRASAGQQGVATPLGKSVLPKENDDIIQQFIKKKYGY